MDSKPYNFFGLAPAQQIAPTDPALMALPVYNNPTGSQASPSGGGIDPKTLGQMMMNQQGNIGYSPLNQAYDGLTNQAPGNPLGLSSGTSFSPSDIASLRGAFNG